MKTASILIFMLILTGCAAGPTPEVLAHRAYVTQYRPMAISGTMKWSDYYTGLYSKSLNARAPASVLNRMNDLIRYAQQYEAGTMSKEAFEHERRAATIGIAADQEVAAERERTRRMAVAAAFANTPPIQSTYQIVKSPAFPAPSTYTPITQAPQRVGVTAYFTGRQEQVQTVTHQIGWKCEYRYLSNTFTKIFTTSCPPSVQVE